MVPDFDADVIEGTGGFSVVKRKWEVSIFDLYSLVAERHPIHLPAELLQIFLQRVNLEIAVTADTFDDAADRLDVLRAMLYLQGLKPFIAPFGESISLNKYAGINDRSSGGSARMHEGLREGLTHSDVRVEMWPNELVFGCILGKTGELSEKISINLFQQASKNAELWLELEKHHGVLRAARHALIQAPLMPSLSSSILHVWQGLEGLFPTISTEITFRTSLLLAELISTVEDRKVTYSRSRDSYKDRSRIAHGSQKPVTIDQWSRAWNLLRSALAAILKRGELPNEDALTDEILSR